MSIMDFVGVLSLVLTAVGLGFTLGIFFAQKK